MPKIGDIFEIPLKNEKKAYGQFVFNDIEQGPLIQVFDLIVKNGVQLEIQDIDINTAHHLFPPVITGLTAATRSNLWRIIGNLPVKKFVYPKFVSAYYDEKTGEAYRWFVWDGQEYIRLGEKLPKKYKMLEYLVVWSPYDIAERIETGKYPYPYGDLIARNKFTPR